MWPHGEVDGGLAVLVGPLLRQGAELPQVGGERLGALGDLRDLVGGEDQDGAVGGGARRVLPDGLRVGEGLLAEVRAVGEDAEDGVVAVGAGADLLDAAVGQEEDGVGAAAEGGEGLTGLELALLAARGQFAEDVLLLELPQRGQFAQLGGDDLDAVPGLHEGDPAVTDRVAEPAVDPVRTALHVHPGQRAQQPARADLLHLRHGLGGGGQIPRGGCGQTLLGCGLLRADLFAYRHEIALPIKH